MSRLVFRAAGWISANRETQFRLTDEDQSELPAEDLIAEATARAEARGLAGAFGEGGTIEVGQWAVPFMHVDQPTYASPEPVLPEVAEAAERSLQFAVHHPYDQRLPTDIAHWAAQGVLANLGGRGGLDHILDELDDDVRQEIVSEIAAIVRRVMATSKPAPSPAGN